MRKSSAKAVDVTALLARKIAEIPEERIAALAYEKWKQRGCPIGDDEQDWFAARAELEHEVLSERH
jgi:hypothetical protein